MRPNGLPRRAVTARARRGRGRAFAVVAALAVVAGGCSRTATPVSDDVYRGPVLSGAANPLGAKWDWPRVNTYGPYLRLLSGGATWQEAVWCQLEPRPGVWQWTALDDIVASSQRLGFQLDIKLRTGSCWATGGKGGHARGLNGQRTASAPPADQAQYVNFVTQVVDRYRGQGVRTWAIENEPNTVVTWNATAAAYGRLVRAAAQVIRAQQSDAVILDGGISSTGWGTAVAQHLLDLGQAGAAVAAWNSYFDRRQSTRSNDFPPVSNAASLARALRGTQPARDLQFLAVTKSLIDDGVVDALQVHFYEAWTNVGPLMATARALAGPLIPIQVWEAGRFYPDAPAGDPAAAAETVKTTVLLLAAGATRVIWLPLLPDSGGQQADAPRSGLVTSSGAAVSAGTAFAALVPATTGAQATLVPGSGGAGGRTAGGGAGGGGIEGVRFVRPGGTTFVVWASGTAAVIPGGAPAGAQVTDLSGARVAWPAPGLTVGSSPVFIEVATGASL
jgi:hypothetical protein